ncbi:hypothetical protein [Paenibacillus whitsoniae]|nr:hypothetical protein [Paenibacillus whitsoniae]
MSMEVNVDLRRMETAKDQSQQTLAFAGFSIHSFIGELRYAFY